MVLLFERINVLRIFWYISKNIKLLGFILVMMLYHLDLKAQNPKSFSEEITILTTKTYNYKGNRPLTVFVGSSSIKQWKDVQNFFRDYEVINYGFGGSTFEDVLFYYDELILSQKPSILFIYEGDNDLVKSNSKSVFKNVRKLVNRIKKDLPKTKIILISPKPSIARWHLKKRYVAFNHLLKGFAHGRDEIQFANVWDIMLDKDGNVNEHLFMADGLHMNERGYQLWAQVLAPYLKTK